VRSNLLVTIGAMLLLAGCADIDDPRSVEDQQLQRNMNGAGRTRPMDQPTAFPTPPMAPIPGEY
jgi:hypothetical protein